MSFFDLSGASLRGVAVILLASSYMCLPSLKATEGFKDIPIVLPFLTPEPPYPTTESGSAFNAEVFKARALASSGNEAAASAILKPKFDELVHRQDVFNPQRAKNWFNAFAKIGVSSVGSLFYKDSINELETEEKAGTISSYGRVALGLLYKVTGETKELLTYYKRLPDKEVAKRALYADVFSQLSEDKDDAELIKFDFPERSAWSFERELKGVKNPSSPTMQQVIETHREQVLQGLATKLAAACRMNAGRVALNEIYLAARLVGPAACKVRFEPIIKENCPDLLFKFNALLDAMKANGVGCIIDLNRFNC